MDLYLLKFPYRKILLPLAKKLKFINPDIISYAATIVTVFTFFCYLYALKQPEFLLWAIGSTFLRMTLNTIDGVIAIERGDNLKLKGEIVNALPDRYSDIFLLAGITLSGLCSTAFGIIGLASTFLVSYTGMLGKALGVEWQQHGPCGKVERLILIMIFTLLQYFSTKNGLNSPTIFGFNLTYLELCMVIFLILGQLTVFNRLIGMTRQIRKLEWQKFSNNLEGKKILITYDSQTGNTEKVAKEIADSLKAELKRIEDVKNTENYDLVIFGSPNIRKKPTRKIVEFLDKKPVIKNYAVFITSGMPVWRHISTSACISYFKNKLGKKPVGTFNCKGYHTKYKTYKAHPNQNDLFNAYLFGISLERRI